MVGKVVVCRGVDDVGREVPFDEQCGSELAVVGVKLDALSTEDAVLSCGGRGDQTRVFAREALVQRDLADAVHEAWEVAVLNRVALITEVLRSCQVACVRTRRVVRSMPRSWSAVSMFRTAERWWKSAELEARRTAAESMASVLMISLRRERAGVSSASMFMACSATDGKEGNCRRVMRRCVVGVTVGMKVHIPDRSQMCAAE